ncbi:MULTISPECIES: dioxygenase [unclassified Rubrivivax]|uniref:dioxygenase family protein n=1 Tax=unclassified Rubrivivax TaxID=2649762 RepID=UPI001E4B451C|nr:MULTISPECIES: class III extradiol ring-cleavage dioxygenase [unclassified Rubrivivax]MCC9595377.1 dioxygenase [Rubrivivax sp. JA1055]MCC9647116.1 dioxygenase [Rubrivivax sp. JA1029]
MNPLPPLFLSHGSPMTALEPGEAGDFFRRLGPAIDATFGRPRAILAISAHGLTREPVLVAGEQHETIHDFGGFPDALYRLRYDAPGAPELATRVQALLADAGIPVQRHDGGGLDHGVWTPLLHVYPDADLPVLPLAWPPGWAPARLFALGRALAPLAADGVLVLASGSITHNLRRVFAALGAGRIDAPATPESTAFRDWFADKGEAADWPALLAWRSQAPHAALMHPSDEHLLPYFVAAGAAGVAPVARRVHASLTYGDLGMDAYAFGPQAARLAAALAG